MKDDKIKSIIESLLFAKGKSISIIQLAKNIGVSKKKTAEVVGNIVDEYIKRDGGLTIIQKDDRIQMVSAPKNASYVNKMLGEYTKAKLSRVALETLSIIAYRGPITKLEIEAIRGVNCSFVLRNLLLRGLIVKKRTGDKNCLYEISFNFLKEMGIRSIKELPNYEKLSKDNRVETIIKIHTEKNRQEKDNV